MKRNLAFVLGGGGARGAMQVGALRALLEAGIYPDMLVGTSVGAVNAAFMALKGISLGSVDELAIAWQDAATADLLPANYLWLTVRALFNRPVEDIVHRMQSFYLDHGMSYELQFGDIPDVRLILVASDLNSGRPKLFGLDPQQSVLEALMASTALPPWVTPLQSQDQLLMDGGVVSNLPIEPALSQGATQIIALGLCDPREDQDETNNFSTFVGKLISTMEQRQFDLEMALAAARGVPVRYIPLQWNKPVPIWNFHETEALMTHGYTLTRQEINRWQSLKGRSLNPFNEFNLNWVKRLWNRWNDGKFTGRDGIP
jgi:NTE family protein